MLSATLALQGRRSHQFNFAGRSVHGVSFISKPTKDRILERGIITLNGRAVFIGDADLRTAIVEMYEAPPEMPDTVIIGRQSHYGRVLSFRRDLGSSTRIQNGIRTARMRLSSVILSAVQIANEVVFVSYLGQPRTCRRCDEEGHEARGCKKPRCYSCETQGHVASDCHLAPLCGVCLIPDHHV